MCQATGEHHRQPHCGQEACLWQLMQTIVAVLRQEGTAAEQMGNQIALPKTEERVSVNRLERWFRKIRPSIRQLSPVSESMMETEANSPTPAFSQVLRPFLCRGMFLNPLMGLRLKAWSLVARNLFLIRGGSCVRDLVTRIFTHVDEQLLWRARWNETAMSRAGRNKVEKGNSKRKKGNKRRNVHRCVLFCSVVCARALGVCGHVFAVGEVELTRCTRGCCQHSGHNLVTTLYGTLRKGGPGSGCKWFRL